MLGNVKDMLKTIENGLRRGILTVGRQVDSLTMVCMTERLPAGIVYHQFTYEQLPVPWQDKLKNRIRGEIVGSLKIVAVYDIWPLQVGLGDGIKDIG